MGDETIMNICRSKRAFLTGTQLVGRMVTGVSVGSTVECCIRSSRLSAFVYYFSFMQSNHYGIAGLQSARRCRYKYKHDTRAIPLSVYRYTSLNGLVSLKHESQTSLTTLTACMSSLHLGRAMTDCTALFRTQFWNCCVRFQLPRVIDSLLHLHSPLSIDARIC